MEIASEYATPPGAPLCPDAASVWCQKFDYGPWGNRRVIARTNIGPTPLEPQSYGSNNRIADTGWIYDNGTGNLTRTPLNDSFSHDAENRQEVHCALEANPANCTKTAGAGRTLYSYDGEGRRVKKSSGLGTTVFVYDAMGNLAAEYGGVSQSAPLCTPCYLTVDHLGSTRMIADGSVRERRDYLPFGEDTPLSGPRQGIAGYGQSANVNQKFTGKERDAESALDYFGARYFSGAQGRFSSPDPFNPMLEFAQNNNEEDQQAFNYYIGIPQHWNRYAYALNNPLAFKDEDGRVPIPLIIAAAGAAAASPAGQRALIAGSAYLQRYAPQLQRIALTSGQAISNAVFTLGPALRGRVVEALSGAPRAFANFPALDKPLTAQGIATSIKSVDVFAKTYQSGNALFNRLVGYVDQLAGARGGQLGQATIKAEQIRGRLLEIIVPKGGIQAAQETFQRIIQYAKKYKDLEVVFKETQ